LGCAKAKESAAIESETTAALINNTDRMKRQEKKSYKENESIINKYPVYSTSQ
jgi:hypothetical protein